MRAYQHRLWITAATKQTHFPQSWQSIRYSVPLTAGILYSAKRVPPVPAFTSPESRSYSVSGATWPETFGPCVELDATLWRVHERNGRTEYVPVLSGIRLDRYRKSYVDCREVIEAFGAVTDANIGEWRDRFAPFLVYLNDPDHDVILLDGEAPIRG